MRLLPRSREGDIALTLNSTARGRGQRFARRESSSRLRARTAIEHATPRTVTAGDASLYAAFYGSRFAVQSSDAFTQAIGYPRSPIDDVLVFHIVFGKTVPDVSLNAVG